ncbi:MAG TPA: hypothetical protein VGE57_07380 [Solimonas sp.]
MRKTFFCFALLGLSLALPARADVLVLPESAAEAPAEAPVAKPVRGASQAQVLRAFGQPAEQYAPVGGGSAKQPPITRWDYAAFSVFFERDKVVDVVVKGQPAPVRNVEQLEPQY